MIGPDLSRVAVYVRPGATDMRKGINGLSIITAEQMGGDPLCGAAKVALTFCVGSLFAQCAVSTAVRKRSR